MAEVVQRNLEARLDELDELERKGLFSREEIRTIVRKRRNFEYQINRRIVQKEDYLRYIQYEISLDMLRRKRKKRVQIISPKSTVDYSIVQHVHHLFQLATNRFKGDLKLWLQYAQYCEKVGSLRQLSQVYGQALCYHSHNAGLWISAAKAEFEVNKNISAARTVMLKALRVNPDTKQVWHEYFRLELLYVDKVLKRRQILGIDFSETDHEVVSDAVLQHKAASIVFHQAMETISGDVLFCIRFLSICQLFEQTTSVQNEIYEHLVEQHNNNEEARDVLARKPLSDYFYSAEKETVTKSENAEKAARKDCRRLYKAAVTDISTAKMWTFFLRFVLDWCKQKMPEKTTTTCYKQLLELMEQASSLGCLSVEMWHHRIEVNLRLGFTDDALTCSVSATSDHSDSLDLWMKCAKLHCLLCEGSPDTEDIFEHALQSVSQKDSLPLWSMWTEYCQSACPEKVETVFQRASNADKIVSEVMNSCYLEWKCHTAGIKEARQTFQRLIKYNSVPLSLYLTLIQLEVTQPRCHMKRLRLVYEKAVQDHGSLSVDLWIQYIKSELQMEGGRPGKVPELHWRALRSLEGEQASLFVEQYTLLTV
ncbi:U3 small nucleolar RNA-associated protein 6 homolog [Corticium candelabrum]|uniref:U3 small nucleolar RNA-associated protein 6 homolog n=1 Tax=Corticium candelabrum TaxID=121492 RepID=UPI002E330A7C|nr:U3 small nucleolar RNA-associated protein 6 homolog [Corticium candelabrum]